MYEQTKNQGSSSVSNNGTSSNLLASIAASPNLMNAILAQNHVDGSADSVMPSQRRYTMPMDAANAARSAFCSGANSSNSNANHIGDLSLASVDLDTNAPSSKKIRRLISDQVTTDSYTASSLSSDGLNQQLKDAINRKFSASATPNIESLLLLRRMYHQCLLTNLINPSPDFLLQMQQLNSLQQVMQSSQVNNVPSPGFFTTNTTGGNISVPETSSATAAAAAAASLNLISATSASVIAQQQQQQQQQNSQSNYSAMSPLISPSQNPLLTPLTPIINFLLQNMHLTQQQQPGNSHGLATNSPVVTSASCLSLPSVQPQAPSVTDLCNLLLQQQQQQSALLATAALNSQCQTQSTLQQMPSHNTSSVVINGQDNGNAHTSLMNKSASLQNPNQSTGLKFKAADVVPGRSQQLSVCRKKLEARMASIIAQELVSDEESNVDNSLINNNINSCNSEALPAESENEGKCSADSGVSSPVLAVKKVCSVDSELNSERKYSQATSTSTSSSEEMVVDIDSSATSTTSAASSASKHSATAAEMILKISAPKPIMITHSS
uniref:Uncharacterized protein n=1 Tax=Syphacia muris TaxID=451379 RepID=A0A0N5AZE9_9BILA